MFLILLKKLFSFSRKSKFRSLGFKFHDVIKYLNIKKKHILVNYLWSKHSLSMKFGQFISYYKRKLSKKSTETATWKLVPDPFLFAKNEAQPLVENEIFEASCQYSLIAKLLRFNSNSNNSKTAYSLITKLLRFVQVSTWTSSDSFLRRIPWKLERVWN